jgi:hypothetical protein
VAGLGEELLGGVGIEEGAGAARGDVAVVGGEDARDPSARKTTRSA